MTGTFSETIEEQARQLAELQTRADEQGQLITRLEKDLSHVGARAASDEPREDLSTLEVLEHMGSQAARPADGSVVSILSAQRDRLRQKVSSLEEELAEAKTREKVQEMQIEKMTDDNVKLYGKIKFLQGYGNKGSVAVPVDAPNYSEQYEQRLDPFTKFSQSEKQRTYSKLQLHDRATLTIGRVIMGSGAARMLFFFYLVVLHLLVFLVLYRYAFSDLVDQSFQKECVENFAQHMKEQHSGH